MTKETYAKIADEINTMTDEEYNQILAEAKEMDKDLAKNIVWVVWEKISVI